MSDGLLDNDAAARFISITPNELKNLAGQGVIQRVNGKYHPVALVQGYIKHLKEQQTKPPTQAEIAAHLDMSERNLRDVLRGLGMDHRECTKDEIRVAYIRDLRDKAAGRGGDDQANLTKARANEANVNAALKTIQYNREIGALILGEDAEKALNDWARFANREIIQGFHKLVAEVQSSHNVKINDQMVQGIVIPTTERIKNHAQQLGADLVAGVEEFPGTSHTTDG